MNLNCIFEYMNAAKNLLSRNVLGVTCTLYTIYVIMYHVNVNRNFCRRKLRIVKRRCCI